MEMVVVVDEVSICNVMGIILPPYPMHIIKGDKKGRSERSANSLYSLLRKVKAQKGRIELILLESYMPCLVLIEI